MSMIPRDLAPFNGGTMVMTPIGEGGVELEHLKTFKNFLTASTPTTSRTDETVPSGDGPDYTLPQSEQESIAVEFSTFDPIFHGKIAGRQVVQGQAYAPVMGSIQPIAAGTYTFGTENFPTANAEGHIYIYLTDDEGTMFVDMGDSSEALAEGQYKYDVDTKTLSVASSYGVKNFEIMYFSMVDDVTTIESAEILSATEFKLEFFGVVQSVAGKTKHRRYWVVQRAAVSGDLTSMASQKSPVSTVSYTFVSQTPPVGKRAFTEQFLPVYEPSAVTP